MKKYFNKFYLPAMLGAIIEYYDIALYGYMAPVLIQVFLPQFSKLSAYCYYFTFAFFASLFRLMGAHFFGKIGDQYGRKKALYYSMLLTSCITFVIGLLPTYEKIGIFATIFFALCRALQRFCLGGEYNGGIIYCLEHEKNPKKHGLISGLYCALTVSGIILASIVATITNYFGPSYFRISYLISFLLAILIYLLRGKLKETPEYLKQNLKQNLQQSTHQHIHTNSEKNFQKNFEKNSKQNLTKNIQQNLTKNIKQKTKTSRVNLSSNFKTKELFFNYHFIAIAMAALFFGVLYGLPTKIFNAILPIAIGINTTQIMLINSIFLIVYLFLLILFGVLSDKIGSKKMMRFSVLSTIFLTYPMILMIETKIIFAIIIAKAIFAILTAAFISPFHVWAYDLFTTKFRYRNISMGYSFGKCFSSLLLVFTVIVFKHYGNLINMGFVLIVIAIVTYKALNFKLNLHKLCHTSDIT